MNSTRGKSGGYHLVKQPSDVSLADVINIFEGTVGMLACASRDKYKPCEFCKDETTCKIRKAFLYVYESSSAILKSTTLQDLV